MDSASAPVSEYEYIVVGSGAGGGTLAARLAEAGCRVLLLEAGGDPRQLRGGDPVYPEADRLPDDYDVPCFHGFASENEAMKWDFFVRHYADDALQRRDDKYCTRSPEGKIVDGVLVPTGRESLGGCTAHNAQILVYPHDEDWDGLAQVDRRSVLECAQHATVLREAGELPPPASIPLAQLAGVQSDPAWMEGLAPDREGDSGGRSSWRQRP